MYKHHLGSVLVRSLSDYISTTKPAAAALQLDWHTYLRVSFTMATAAGIGRDSRLEAGLLTAGEKSEAYSMNAGSGNPRPEAPTTRVTVLRRAVVALAVCCLIGLSFTTVAGLRLHTCPGRDDITTTQANSTLPDTWGTASSDALHEFLHRYFLERGQCASPEPDREAVEVVQTKEDVVMPKLPQLIRRQDDGGNGTVTTSVPPPDTTTTDETTTTGECYGFLLLKIDDWTLH